MGSCEDCHKKNLFRKTGNWVKVDGKDRREMICRCGHVQLEDPPQEIKVKPKILYFDIETAPFKLEMQRFDLSLKSGYLDWHDITKPFFIICWAAAWVDLDTDGQEKIMTGAVTGWEAKRRTDKRNLKILHDLLSQADYVVGHNSKGFDVKKVETRFILNNMPAPYEFQQRDTLTIVKKRFKNESNALDYWMKLLGGQRKDDMHFEDWLKVCQGDQKTINKMVHYNKGDSQAGMVLLKKLVRYIDAGAKKRAPKVFP